MKYKISSPEDKENQNTSAAFHSTPSERDTLLSSDHTKDVNMSELLLRVPQNT
jgi:hypothetical protein